MNRQFSELVRQREFGIGIREGEGEGNWKFGICGYFGGFNFEQLNNEDDEEREWRMVEG